MNKKIGLMAGVVSGVITGIGICSGFTPQLFVAIAMLFLAAYIAIF